MRCWIQSAMGELVDPGIAERLLAETDRPEGKAAIHYWLWRSAERAQSDGKDEGLIAALEHHQTEALRLYQQLSTTRNDVTFTSRITELRSR